MSNPTEDSTEAQELAICDANDWFGPDDPDNPRNFHLFRRTASTVTVALLAFVSTFAASIYSAGVHEVTIEFDVSEEVAVLPLALFNIGLALGPLLGAPLCEALGRKIVFLSTSPIFALFTLGAGFAQNVAALTVCRFFAGVFAAPAISNASATIIDYTAGRSRAVSMAFYYAIPTFGACVGPLVGGFVVQAKDWRWTQFTTVFFIVAFCVPVLFTRESYKNIILQRRAKKLHLSDHEETRRSLIAILRHFVTTLLIRPLHMLATEPIVTFVCIYSGFLFGLMYVFVTVSSWVYQHYYGFGTTGQSLSFLGVSIGAANGPLPIILIDHFFYQPRLKAFRESHSSDEQLPPENRLFPAMIASLLLPAALFVFAWTVRPEIHWIVPIIFQGITIMLSNLIYSPSNLYMMDTYGPLYGASAAAAAMFTRYLFSAMFPLFALKMYKALGVGRATSILAFCTVAMAPIPWLFFRYGESLRKKSTYETSA